MYPSTRKGTKDTMVSLGVALNKYGTLVACRKAVTTVLASTSWLDGKSRSDILNQAMEVARTGLLLKKKESIPQFVAYNLDGVMKAWNRAHKRTWVKTRGTLVHTQMKLQRDRDDPVVFYLVSSHQKPQPAHEPLQGKLLVDYYWRSTLAGDIRLGSVAKFVKNHKVKTVQWSMGAPHYLLTRVNCRHFLYPVKTNDVLNLGLRQINAKYQKKPTGIHRPISDAQRWKDYKDLRATVLKEAKRKTGL